MKARWLQQSVAERYKENPNEVPAESTVDFKSKVMKEWYRKQLKSQIPPLLEKWEKAIGVKSK